MRVDKIFLIFLFFSIALTRKNLKQATKKAVQQHKTIVEANHFYSNYETQTNYQINSVQKDKSLIFILTQKDRTEKQLQDNPITITLKSGQQSQACTFKSFNNLCGIKNVKETNMKLKIQCKSTPCQLSWVIYQPSAIDNDGKQQIEKYVQVNQNYIHATMIVSCNDPNIKTFINDIHLYTNSIYQKIINNGVVYFLFDNQDKGSFFLTSQNQAVKSCANIIVKHSVDEVIFNQKNNVLEDFIIPNKSNWYTINKLPDFDMRIDSFFHLAKGLLLSQKQGLIVNLIGQQGNQNITLSSITILGQEKNTEDFSAIFKLPKIKYQKMYFEIKSIGQQIIISSIDFVSNERHDVNVGENSYFDLKKGQKINYKLLPEAQEKDDKKITYIYISDEKKISLSLHQCKKQVGCQFTLEALEDIKGDLYFGEKAVKDVKEVVVTSFQNSITKKLREGESILLKTTVKANKAIQALVNSPNVLIYASSKQKCPNVSAECHEKVLNSHNPIVYESKVDIDLYFLIKGLDLCEFTLTIVQSDSQFIKLTDSIPLTYLFDDSQKELLFQFKVAKKQDVYFNLIAPVNELLLIVYNTEKIINDKDQSITSSQGFITYQKENMENLNFIVKVQKKQEFVRKYIHFTLLVSTKQGNIRLQAGLEHFQTLAASQQRDFVFQFQPKKDIMINFYLHNMLGSQQKIDLSLKLSNSDDYQNENAIVEQTIDSQSDVFDIKQVAQKLCKKDAGQNCQLFLRLTNKMSVELDITVTLLITDAIIELKDGIWGTYQINQIAQTSHFYFLPKNKNRSVIIQYLSQMVDLKVMYTIWKTNDQSFSPDQWPFLTEITQQVNKERLKNIPIKFIHIDNFNLQKCWPNCVILLSIFKDSTSVTSAYKNYQQYAQFKILASSNFIQIPQKTKIEIVLKKGETKHLLVDLKYVLDKQSLTFFTYFTIGSVQLNANVYEEDNPRCPTPDDQSDFRFGVLETQISLSHILDELSKNDMNNDKNKYICILANAYLDSKFSIEYSSDNQLIKHLTADSYLTKKLEAHQTAYFQMDGAQEMVIKITRTSGFPYLSNKICKQGDDFQQCLDDFKGQAYNSTQLADKMTSISITPCQKCIIFIKVRSQQPSQINLHAQSKYIQTQLIQNQMITDDLSKDEENSYLITSIRRQEVIINIQIIKGNIQVNLYDFKKINITKSNQKGGNNIIHFVIPPAKEDQTSLNNKYGGAYLDYYDFSSFSSMHMTIKSQDKKEAMYTITYSSGDPEIYLQDGLISTYGLMSNRTIKFLYKNPAFTKVYLHISMNDAKVLNKLKIKMHALANQFDQQSGVQIIPQKPKFNKKTPNPTMIMELPANKFYQIQITSSEKQMYLITLGINNQQIIFLPIGHQFPVQLKKGQHIYLVVNVPFQTFLDIYVKKCDQSKLSLAYTLSYDDFIKEQFAYQQDVGQEELLTQLQIKIKNSGNAYIKVQSPDDDDSLITIKALYTFLKTKKNAIKPGNNGLIEYRMLDYSNAELSFAPIVCASSNKNCQKDFTYSYISSGQIQSIYSQLMCSSILFDLQDRQFTIPSDFKSIPTPKKGTKLTFTHQITQNIDFIGIKAFNNKTQQIIYYHPIQLMTVLGQINKGTRGKGFIIGLVVIISLCLFLIISRRMYKNRQNQYEPLQNLDY